MSVQLLPLRDDQYADLRATLQQIDLWPREKFPQLPSEQDLAKAVKERFWSLFSVLVDGQAELYASVVAVGLPYFELYPKHMGVRTDDGRLAVIQIVRWAFTQGGLRDLYFYLPASYAYAAEAFLELGFEPVRDKAAAAEGMRLLAIDRPTFADLADVYEGYEVD